MVKKDIQKYRQLLLVVLIIFSTEGSYGQSAGDFRSKADGLWSAITTWERYNGAIWIDATAGQIPTESSSVWIQVQQTVTVNTNQSVLNLHLSAGINSTGGGCSMGVCSSFLVLGSNSLEVFGFMRTFFGAEGTTPTLGNNDFSSSIGVSQSQIQSDNNGGIIVRGDSRTFLNDGAWAANHNSFRVVFDMSNEVIITIDNTFKARRIVIRNGTVNSGTNRLSADGGGASGSSGEFIIEDGGKLISARTGASAGLQVISKGSNSACQEFRINEGGVLELFGTSPYIAAASIINEGLIIFGSSGNQTLLQGNSGGVAFGTYDNLRVAGSGVKTLANAITVNDSLMIEGSATISRASFALNYASSSTLVFRGTNAQLTTEENWPDPSIPNLVVDNSYGLSLHEPKSISNRLNLINGNLISESYLLTLSAAASVDGGSSDSFVSGPMAHTGSGEKYFPVGKGGIFRPAHANISGTGHEYSLEIVEAGPVGNPVAPILLLSSQYHWQLETVAGSLSTGSIKFTYEAEDILSDDEDIRIGFSSSTSGDLAPLTTIDNSQIGEITVGVNPAGVYGLGTINPQSVLPVVWKSFTIKQQDRNVVLHWETSLEKDVSHFEILKSEEGGSLFKKIAEIESKGNSMILTNYSFTDILVNKSRNFYKIRQVDVNGSSSTTEILRIDLKISASPKIWTTRKKNLYIENLGSERVTHLEVYSKTGEVVFTTNYETLHSSNGFYEIPLHSLNTGMYLVIVHKDGYTLRQKVWLAH